MTHLPQSNRRSILKKGIAASAVMLFGLTQKVWAKTYMTVDQAKTVIWGDTPLEKIEVTLTKAQMKSIKKISKVRVRNAELNVWKTPDGGWFILDQVIGKHENIDLTVGLDNQGRVTAIELIEYRESYGYEIENPKWISQFFGISAPTVLKLGRDIKNISGATLSCRHVTDGINRLTQTWDQVLKHL